MNGMNAPPPLPDVALSFVADRVKLFGLKLVRLLPYTRSGLGLAAAMFFEPGGRVYVPHNGL
jgi:hypothetical protein